MRSLVNGGWNSDSREYHKSRGVAESQQPVWIEGREDLGLEGRLFSPVKCNGTTFGLLCVIDPDRSMSETELREVERTADQVAMLLYTQTLLSERDRNREEAVLRDLFANDSSSRNDAEDQITDTRMLEHVDRLVVVTVHWNPGAAHDANQFGAQLKRELTHTESRSALWMTAPNSVTFLIGDDGRESESGALQAALRLARCAVDRWSDVYCGVSDASSSLSGSAVAFRQARLSSRAAEVLPELGRVAVWRELGVFAALLKLPAEDLAEHASIPAVEALGEADGTGELLRTAETFLDCAGDTRKAADILHIHRSTLYHRLGRIESATGLELDNGGVRLALHLALKARRLLQF
ncbi:PucR family transcriptional regulator [Leucobacter sp. GX24907]